MATSIPTHFPILLLLLAHHDGAGPALVRADPAALAVIQIRNEVPFLVLLDASLRAEDVANPALDALLLVQDRSLGFPASGLVVCGVTRSENHAAGVDFMPL